VQTTVQMQILRAGSISVLHFQDTTEGDTADFLLRFGNIESTTRSALTDCHFGFHESCIYMPCIHEEECWYWEKMYLYVWYIQRVIHNFRNWCCHLVKITLGLLVYHQSSPLPRICTVPSVSAMFTCILEVVICECVQHRLQFCLDHLNCIKMAAFQFYLALCKRPNGSTEFIPVPVSRAYPSQAGVWSIWTLCLQQQTNIGLQRKRF
jgi:hypothetical protein